MTLSKIGVVPFYAAQQRQFRSGVLAEQWARQYPLIFDDDDLRLAKSQPQYHFFEWLGAVVLHTTTGYLSLVEKYEFSNHARKVTLLRQMLPQPVLQLVTARGAQCPDLFVYSPDQSDWFFCEVKGPIDRVRKEQEDYFAELAMVSGKPVALLGFEEMVV